MRTQFTAARLVVELHHLLEHGAEDGRGDGAPIELAQRDQALAHRGVERGHADVLFEQTPVDIGEHGVVLGQRLLAPVQLAVEGAEELLDHRTGVAAVRTGMELDQVVKTVLGLEDARVVGEQAKQQSHQKDFELVAGVAVLLQRIVQFTGGQHCAHIDRVLFADELLAVAGDEVEEVNLLRQLAQREVMHLVVVEVVQLEAPEVADEHVARQLVVAEPREVLLRLSVGAGQVFAAALLLDEQGAFPEQVDVAVARIELLDALLEARHLAALHAEDLEEGIKETLGVGVFRFGVLPLVRKARGAVANVVPAQGHVLSPARISTRGVAGAAVQRVPASASGHSAGK